MMLPTLLFVCYSAAAPVASTAAAPSAPDMHYEMIYQSNTTEVKRFCFTGAVPSYVNGTYMFATVGAMEMGHMKFVDVLDGFGKLHSFELDGGNGGDPAGGGGGGGCFSAKMMNTAFYNASLAKGEVTAGVLFDETVPPRKGLDPLRNILAPNDNVIINTVKLGEDFMMVTDSPTTLDFDPITLGMLDTHQWDDKMVRFGSKGMLSSGHPVRRPRSATAENGQLIDVVVEAPYVGGGAGRVDVFAVADDAPTTRVKLNGYDLPKGFLPYFHSFGVTSEYVVLPHQNVTTDFSVLETGKPMSAAFSSKGLNVAELKLVPLDGSTVRSFALPESVAYAHTVNCFENATGIVLDLTVFNLPNPFSSANTFTNIDTNLDKASRDAMSTRGMVQRFVLHMHGPPTVTTEILSRMPADSKRLREFTRFHEFTRIDDTRQGLPYCVFYVNEWFHDDASKGTMAIVKQNVCTGKTTYWHRPAYFPTEAIFVPSDRVGRAEDEGVLLFASLSGEERTSHFHIVNATTMEDVVDAPLPVVIPYAAHGQFYPNLFANGKSRGAQQE